jgi:uncharacterized membrane protein (UPF0127 family)
MRRRRTEFPGVAEVKKPVASKACARFGEDHPVGLRESLELRTTTLIKEDGTAVCTRCHLAVRPWSRMRGLLGRSSLADDEGLLLRPAGSIHMFFMRFAIDAVFCDRDLVVLDVVRDLRPWRMAARRGAKVVIELPVGAGARVAAGDRLAILDP